MKDNGEFNLDEIEKYSEIAFAKVPKVSFGKVKGFDQRDCKNLIHYLRHGEQSTEEMP